MTNDVIIRPVTAADRAAWGVLWKAYLEFYEASVEIEVYESTFARLLSDDVAEMGCFLAVKGDTPVGLVHYIFHRHCWKIEDVCYLQDLYADPAVRGSGVGRALIEAVYVKADECGVQSVYWMTQDFNATARVLYDRIATLTPFIKYQR